MMVCFTINIIRFVSKETDMSEQTASEILGEYKARKYTLFAKAVPSFNEIQKFAVNIRYRNIETQENIEIVRIDNYHAPVHIHKKYLDQTGYEELEENPGFYKAWSRLQNNRKKYAEKHDRNHHN